MNITSILFYFIIYSIASIMFHFAQKNDRTLKIKNIKVYRIRKNIFIFLSFSIILFISGWRFGIGTDYDNYALNYLYITSQGNIINAVSQFRFEPGFIFLNYIVKYIFNDSQYLFIVSSFITLFFMYLAIWGFRSKINVGLALFIYLILFHNISFNAVRQFLAISIVFYSFKYIFNRNFIKYLISILIASTFHYTALFLLAFYFLYGNKPSKVYIRLVGIIIIAFSILFFNGLLDYLIEIASYFGYSGYLDSLNQMNYGVGSIIVRLPILLLILLFGKVVINYDKRTSFFIYIMVLELLLSFFAYKIEYFTRFLLIFNMVNILFLPFLVKSLAKKKLEYVLVSLFVFSYIIYNSIQQFLGGITNDSIPYVNIFGWLF